MPGMFRRSAMAVLAAVVCLPLSTAVADPQPIGQPVTNYVPVSWAGETWLAKNSPVLRAGPAPNYWLAAPTNVSVDADGYLHLSVEKIGGRWFCAAIQSTKDYGYGTYRFVISTPLSSFDPNAVVGMFTYNNSPAYGHQEIDVELSKWGVPAPTAANAQYVVQPWRWKNHMRRFLAPPASALTYEYTWRPSGVVFKLYDGNTANAPVIKTWRTNANPGPPMSGTKLNLNMWLFKGQPPYNNQTQEVVFQNFTYTPATA